VILALPAIAETPDHFPANTPDEFRLYSLGAQLLRWANNRASGSNDGCNT